MKYAANWGISAWDQIADIGAGTGQYSLGLAQLFPEAQILHIDSDPGMNLVAQSKSHELAVNNLLVIDQKIEHLILPKNYLKALVSVHALYLLPNPMSMLIKMYNWLEPGGEAILVDTGRLLSVLPWQWATGKHLLWNHGWKKTLEIFRAGNVISQHHRRIRKMQRRGVCWAHSHQEFIQAVQAAGFHIEESGITFRGASDWVRVRKSLTRSSASKRKSVSTLEQISR